MRDPNLLHGTSKQDQRGGRSETRPAAKAGTLSADVPGLGVVMPDVHVRGVDHDSWTRKRKKCVISEQWEVWED